MKYKNAQAILPDALVKELQSYVQGEYIYVPVEQKRQKRWGEVSGYRKELEKRNWQIKQEYQKGSSMDRLGEKYGLSIESEPDEGTRVTIRIPAIPYTPENAERLESQKYIQRRSADEKESG